MGVPPPSCDDESPLVVTNDVNVLSALALLSATENANGIAPPELDDELFVIAPEWLGAKRLSTNRSNRKSLRLVTMWPMDDSPAGTASG